MRPSTVWPCVMARAAACPSACSSVGLDREDLLVGVEGRFELALEAPGVGNRRKAPGGAVDVARAQMQLREQQGGVEVARLFVDETGIGLDGRRQLADPEKFFCGPESRVTVA